MSNAKPIILGAIIGAAAVYVSLQYHVVRSDDGFYLLARAPQASLGLAYADVRNMSPEELAKRPQLARAMTAHSARSMLANNSDVSATGIDSLTEGGSDLFDQARDRLKSVGDDWNAQPLDGVPKPPKTSLDAPIWNPFAEDTFEIPDEAAPVGSIAWPNNDPVAQQFEGESPFSDITEQLDDTRDTFASQTRELSNQFQQQTENVSATRAAAKPFDFDADSGPRYTTNKVITPPTADTANVTRASGLLRDDSSELRDALNRRAREIYEESRRRAAEPIDSLINRSESRAASVIDELVSPPSIDDALNRAANAITPSRYTRGK